MKETKNMFKEIEDYFEKNILEAEKEVQNDYQLYKKYEKIFYKKVLRLFFYLKENTKNHEIRYSFYNNFYFLNGSFQCILTIKDIGPEHRKRNYQGGSTGDKEADKCFLSLQQQRIK